MSHIRPAEEEDFFGIIEIARQVVEEPDAFLFDEHCTTEELEAFWLPDPAMRAETFVLEASGFAGIIGAYVLYPAAHGRGAHMAHGSYMVAKHARGRGFGRALCLHSVAMARQQGYTGILINMVVATNSSARGMCAACGFQTLCTIPRAFQHPELGLVDAFSMFYDLQQTVPNKVQAAGTRLLVDPKSRPADSAPAADVLTLQVGNQAHFRPRLQTAGTLEVHPALPQGLALHPETGVITGTPVLAVEDTTYCIKATVAEILLKVDAQEDSQCEDVSMSINEDFATRVDCVREIEDMLPEPCKTRAYGDWMIWMVHRAWLDDPSLTDLNFGNMHMPPPHIERRIAPKLMEAMARNTHLEKLTLSNSNLLKESRPEIRTADSGTLSLTEPRPVPFRKDAGKASGVQLANALRANSSLKTLNLESNWLDSNAVRELALAIKDNLSSKIECLRFSHQKQMGQFFGRPTEEAVGQMMQSNDTIVKLGFECDDAHWRNEIDRALLRNNDSWRRRQAPPDGEALPTAEERSLGRIHLVHPPDASASEVLNSYGTLCDYLDHNKKLPTTSQLQNSTRNSGQQITYAKAAPMIKELRSWMLDHSLNKLVEVLDTFETPTCGILRQWSSCNDHWIVEVWVEDRRCTFRSSREPPTSVSDDWVKWLRANSNPHIGLPETRAGA